MRIFGTVANSTVDGKGIRYSLFVQGCNHHCKGCHNKESWDYNGGIERDTDDLINEINSTKLIKGVTFSGGEPFDKANSLLKIIKGVRKAHPNYNYWAYTGYLIEELYKGNEEQNLLLREIDVLVDGEFEIDKRRLDIAFRGSTNQRVIDVKKTLANFDKGIEKVVLFLE